MADTKPNIVFILMDNLGWGEIGCYGGGILRGAATPRIDRLAAEGMRLFNFNVEAQCTPSRSAILTGRHPIRSGTQTVPITGGADGLTRWEVLPQTSGPRDLLHCKPATIGLLQGSFAVRHCHWSAAKASSPA